MNWQESIDEIMEHFDFASCLKAIQAIDFGWVKPDTKEFEVREWARKQLRGAVEVYDPDGYVSHSSGGFKATVWPDGGLLLECVIESWDVDKEDAA